MSKAELRAHLKRLGAKGGKARWQTMSKEQRQAAMSELAKKRWRNAQRPRKRKGKNK